MDANNNQWDSIRVYLVKAATWAFIGKVLTSLLSFFLFVLLTRMLPTSDMGVFFLAFNIATFLSIIARFGLENTMLRFISKSIGNNETDAVKGTIWKGLILFAISSVVVIAVIGGGIGEWVVLKIFGNPMLGELMLLVSIWSVVIAFRVIFSEVFRGFQDIRNAVLSGGLIASATIVVFLLAARFLYDQVTFSAVLYLILISGVISIFISGIVLVSKLKNIGTGVQAAGPTYTYMMQHSWPLLINAITLFVVSQSDIWIVGAFCTLEDVAVYGSAARLVMLTSMALLIVNAVIPPLIADLYHKNEFEELERLLRKVATLAAIPAVIILSVFMLANESVMGLFFGSNFQEGGQYLLVLSLGQLVNVLVGSCGYTLMMTGNQKVMMWISVFSAVVSVITSLILVKFYGVIGVAFGFAIATILQQLAMLFYAKHRCGIWTHVGLKYLAIRSNFM